MQYNSSSLVYVAMHNRLGLPYQARNIIRIGVRRNKPVSTLSRVNRISVPDIQAHKGGEPVVCLTAYTTPMAKQVDPHTDLILVGDSLGMVLYGFETTLPVTLDMMIAHGGAVMRGSSQACVIIDLPFGSYHESKEQAFRSASRAMMETGASGVKLEGGVEMADTIAFLSRRYIPVLSHIGVMPQSVNQTGGYRARGKDAKDAELIIVDAKAVTEAGAFAVVIESTWEPVAREITSLISIPTIGIGASNACDGQILVTEDIVGLFSDFTPKFVKRYGDLGQEISTHAAAYASDVRSRRFPGPEHCFGANKGKAKIATVTNVRRKAI
jgi:3-methyl-2-oxobutanoate hydroxymethyltransferase